MNDLYQNFHANQSILILLWYWGYILH